MSSSDAARWMAAMSIACATGCASRPSAPVLAVERYGDGPTTVIVLHGGPGVPHSYLLPEWKQVIDSNRRVVFYDQRGCGKSTPRGPYTWQQHVEDLDRLILQSRSGPHGRVILAGSSWGSVLALLYAKRHPDRLTALVLSGVPPWPDTVAIAKWYARLTPIRHAVTDSINAGLPVGLYIADSAMIVNSIGAPSMSPLASRFGTYCLDAHIATRASLRSAPPLESMRTIVVPVLIVHGTEKSAVGDGAAALAAVLPHAELHDIRGAGHDPWHDQPDSTFAVVNAFIDRFSRSTGS